VRSTPLTTSLVMGNFRESNLKASRLNCVDLFRVLWGT
jgi:hypothetical protein